MFLDFEGHPFWKADVGLFFLLGLIEQEDGDWTYRPLWAHDRTKRERRRTRRLPDAGDGASPAMHVYHYNHTERTSLLRSGRRLRRRRARPRAGWSHRGVRRPVPGRTGAIQVGVESYGLKNIERLTDFERSHDIDHGAGAVIEYERWTTDQPGPNHPHRPLQRGRRPRHEGRARLAGRPPPSWTAVASGDPEPQTE